MRPYLEGRKSIEEKMIPIFAAALIGVTLTIANPILLVHALNPQPLPPGIGFHFPPDPILRHLPPDPCLRTTACHLSASILHFEPPDPCLHLALCRLPPGLQH